ncbi:unnamed protein product [Rotaria sp. Silwood2]|nr:unnamed protein product [Rotaria sp. Silwood2]CAF3279948.1 unnamed protein product [Rotaria sp. Silwood2]CAF4335648.1 unnamed protein product [Rotaria sp. Silwood2]
MASNSTELAVVHTNTSTERLFVAYFSLIIAVVGTTLNSLTFIVLCRSKLRQAQTRPTLYYMRAMAIFDILMLYAWNIDYYFSTIYGFLLQTLNIPFYALDASVYTYHMLSFPLYLITFDEFRQEFFAMIKCNRHSGRIGPPTGTGSAARILNKANAVVTN